MPQGFVEVSGYSKTDVDRKVDDYLQSLRWNGTVTTQAVYPEVNQVVNVFTNRQVAKNSLIVLELMTRRSTASEYVDPAIICTASAGQIQDLTRHLSATGIPASQYDVSVGDSQHDYRSLAYIYALTGADANVTLSYKLTNLRARCVHAAAIIPIAA